LSPSIKQPVSGSTRTPTPPNLGQDPWQHAYWVEAQQVLGHQALRRHQLSPQTTRDGVEAFVVETRKHLVEHLRIEEEGGPVKQRNRRLGSAVDPVLDPVDVLPLAQVFGQAVSEFDRSLEVPTLLEVNHRE
jgi:hypothetical protein